MDCNAHFFSPFLLLFGFACWINLCAASDVVTTSFGKLFGTASTSGRSFYGVPYAKPPVGKRRFTDPQKWDEQYPGGSRNATSPGSICVSNAQKIGSEDCLFANFFTPANATAQSRLPVLLFIHGGSFVTGTGSDFDGRNLASMNNVIVVTINYRLGSFGFLQVNSTSANFGFKDQREAIRFVKKEVTAFGGDPERLMVFGESAGGISVQLHVLARKSDGLFSHALSESGFPTLKTARYSLNSSTTYIDAAGCTSGTDAALLECLQGKTVQKLLYASEITSPSTANPFLVPGWGPSVDMTEFPEDPIIALQNGNFNLNITVIAGTNTDEGWLFAPTGYVDKGQYRKFVQEVLYGHGRPFNESEFNAVFEVYPPQIFGDNHQMASAVVGDVTFICGTRYMVRMASTYSARKPFLYRFNVPYEAGPLVLHGSELPYVFDMTKYIYTKEQQAVSDAMGHIWSSFPKEGVPGDDVWPAYDNSSDTNILFNVKMQNGKFQTESNRRKKYCDFWEETLYPFPYN